MLFRATEMFIKYMPVSGYHLSLILKSCGSKFLQLEALPTVTLSFPESWNILSSKRPTRIQLLALHRTKDLHRNKNHTIYPKC